MTRRSSQVSRRKVWQLVLLTLFLLTIVMGAGPGVWLVNRPDTILQIPIVYAWGIGWYFAQVVIALVAFFTIWQGDCESELSTESESA